MPAVPPTDQPWTAERIRALGVRTTLATACAAVLGVRKSRAWQLYHERALPFPTIRVGGRVVVPVQPLLELLHIAPEPSAREPGDAEAA